jgi:hypothetical protein
LFCLILYRYAQNGFKQWEFVLGYPNQEDINYRPVIEAIEDDQGIMWGDLSKSKHFYLDLNVSF